LRSSSVPTGKRAAWPAWRASSRAWFTSTCKPPSRTRLAAAFRQLEGAGLQILVAKSGGAAASGPVRRVRLELVGHDRPGIVRDLSTALAKLAVSIDELQTQVASAAMSGDELFKVKALLAVPAEVTNTALRQALEALANEMMVDLEAADSVAG
jgi:glycine cleavage system regulatory protein